MSKLCWTCCDHLLGITGSPATIVLVDNLNHLNSGRSPDQMYPDCPESPQSSESPEKFPESRELREFRESPEFPNSRESREFRQSRESNQLDYHKVI